jgi:DNA-binding NarL/FixJ family response regulator
MNVLADHAGPALDLPDSSIEALVADSHFASRVGLGVLLQRQSWVARTLLAADRDEAVGLARRHKPDVAIIDVSNVGPFIASFLAPVRAARPGMPVLLSSRCALTPRTESAGGVVGMLTPGSTAEDMIGAVRGALVGEMIPPRANQSHLGDLSDREREVLAMISTGATNREIAAAMHVGTETVKTHARTVYRKLGVRNRTEAAQRAVELLAA